MVKLSYFTVEVLQDDAVACEHSDSQAEDSLDTETVYIQVTEGKSFAIRLTVDENFTFDKYDALSMDIAIDGKELGGIAYQRDELVEDTVNYKLVDSIEISSGGRTYLQRFRFEEAETRELKAGESFAGILEQYKEQGSIRVGLSRVCGVTDTTGAAIDHSNKQDIVPRKVVKDKGSSTKASFDLVEQQEAKWVLFTYEEETPMAIFQLKYRTIEALIDQGIVKPKIIRYAQETITIPDDIDVHAENERLRIENEALRTRVKVEEAEQHQELRRQKRKRLQTDIAGDTELTQDRPAYRRLPAADDEVVVLDD